MTTGGGRVDSGHPLVDLARRTIEMYVRRGELPNPLSGPWEDKRAATFVSIKKHGQLRGCIGTLAPTTDSVSREVIQNAVSAATRDPRFVPVTEDELDELEISVDVLSEAEPVRDAAELDPRRYGVIVRSGFKKGVLLPDLEGVDTVDEQVQIACRKAGIGPGQPLTLERFEVKRYR